MRRLYAPNNFSGLQSRSLNWQRRSKARDGASDRQPERCVGMLCLLTHRINTGMPTIFTRRAFCRSCRRLRSFGGSRLSTGRNSKNKIKRSQPAAAPTKITSAAPPHHSGRLSGRRAVAVDLDPPAPSGGRVEVFSRGWARSAVRRSRTHREEVVAQQTVGDAP
jgi:hypothetical protein